MDDIPASETLERLLVCTYSARSVLSSGINDDFVGDKVVKKSLARSEVHMKQRVILLRDLDSELSVNGTAYHCHKEGIEERN